MEHHGGRQNASAEGRVELAERLRFDRHPGIDLYPSPMARDPRLGGETILGDGGDDLVAWGSPGGGRSRSHGQQEASGGGGAKRQHEAALSVPRMPK